MKFIQTFGNVQYGAPVGMDRFAILKDALEQRKANALFIVGDFFADATDANIVKALAKEFAGFRGHVFWALGKNEAPFIEEWKVIFGKKVTFFPCGALERVYAPSVDTEVIGISDCPEVSEIDFSLLPLGKRGKYQVLLLPETVSVGENGFAYIGCPDTKKSGYLVGKILPDPAVKTKFIPWEPANGSGEDRRNEPEALPGDSYDANQEAIRLFTEDMQAYDELHEKALNYGQNALKRDKGGERS